MSKPIFSSSAEYYKKRPYCVVTPGAPLGSYDINTRHATRQAAANARDRATLLAEVLTITQVNKANMRASEIETGRLGEYEKQA